MAKLVENKKPREARTCRGCFRKAEVFRSRRKACQAAIDALVMRDTMFMAKIVMVPLARRKIVGP